MRLIDRFNDFLGLVAALLLFFSGGALTYEVVARYVFVAPTTWAQELAEFSLLWGVFLALGRLISRRQDIAIDMLYARLRPTSQRMSDVVALGFCAAFFALAGWYGGVIAWESFDRGVTTATMLDLPKWWAEAAIPAGCLMAFIQCLTEIVRAASGTDWQPRLGEGHEP